MAGQIRQMIDRLVAEKSRGNAVIASSIRTKLILKGVNVNKYTASSPDDPAVIQQIRAAAAELGVHL